MLLKFTPKVDHLKVVILTPKEGLELDRTQVNLLPGTNEVTNDEWKAMRGNIQAELDSGEISILAQKVGDGRGKPGGRKAVNLKDFPVNLAIKYVRECNNPDTLLKWYKEISKEEVRVAISNKIKKMELDIPEDEVPDTPNESPMSLEDFDKDENGEDEDVSNFLDEDDDPDEGSESDSDMDGLDELDEDELSLKKVVELKAMCEERGIDTKGLSKKGDLIDALMSAEEKE